MQAFLGDHLKKNLHVEAAISLVITEVIVLSGPNIFLNNLPFNFFLNPSQYFPKDENMKSLTQGRHTCFNPR